MDKTTIYNNPIFEFHIAKKIREKYDFDKSLFSLTGNVVFSNFYQVRVFVQKINSKRNISQYLSPAEVNAAGLLDEIYHLAIRKYFRSIYPNIFKSAIENLKTSMGETNLNKLLLDFINLFPPKKVYSNEITPKEYLTGFTNSFSNKEILIEEIILLHFANINPAFSKLKELFDENYFSEKESYNSALKKLEDFFRFDDYKIGTQNTDLFNFLSMPFRIHSGNLWEQLEYIKNEWGIFIDEKLLNKIKSSKDLFTENIQFDHNFDGGGGAPTIVPQYKGKLIKADNLVLGKSLFKYAEESSKEYEEPEQFTPDVNWMPNLILIAKNIYVWLDQLSKKYRREIKTLDQIPDEVFEQLQKWNINGLWLIGIWERSSASKKIKHLMGNTDAVASAYSLYDYQIANDLGGESAFNIFNEKAKKYGIRLASDMVPNHTGIYSKWIIEHPEYFLQLDYPPFPNYSFTGPNLSENPNIEIRLEDQYWEMKDAAVVFERKDLKKGETKYFYHGNDGTNMPWNDTAQLNLMKPEVREALIRKIFEVAKKFSVIRFDAAMTLAKKHYARLWFPEPGKGGDIPSRADFAMTRREFDKHFPNEFWRDVVDRINKEMPETLLLAEAFWLMEGYFVRTLGMHRVYNSAFMNMMMNEENEKYRELITNTLEFEPEILKRYVNFMSNPDEETAIEQFGTEDKYFGVLVLMCTLPGLPMFAHGQIEGYTEKYGMEYKRAYYDEHPKQWLVERHEKEIFPLLKKRYVFSEVENFWIYDFIDLKGNVNENVYIYSNKFNEKTGLVLFNNSYQATEGTFSLSRQKLSGNSSNGNGLYNISIAQNLTITNSDSHFYIFKEAASGLEYIFSGRHIHKKGLHFKMSGYEYKVFLKVTEVFDTSGIYFDYYLNNLGKGIRSIKKDIDNIRLNPIHKSFLKLLSKNNIEKYLTFLNSSEKSNKEWDLYCDKLSEKYLELLKNIAGFYDKELKLKNYSDKFIFQLNKHREAVLLINKSFAKTKIKRNKEILNLFSSKNEKNKLVIHLIFNVVSNINEIYNEYLAKHSISDLRLTIPIKTLLVERTNYEGEITRKILYLNILLKYKKLFSGLNNVSADFLKLRSQKKLFEYLVESTKGLRDGFSKNEFFTSFIDVNEYKGVVYYSKENFEKLIDFLIIYIFLKYFELNQTTKKTSKKEVETHLRFLKKIYSINLYLKTTSQKSKYIFKELLNNLELERNNIY